MTFSGIPAIIATLLPFAGKAAGKAEYIFLGKVFFMKKYLVRGLACALAAASILSLCACSSGEKQDESTAPRSSSVSSSSSVSDSVSAPASSAVSTPAESSTDDEGLFASVEELINTDVMQEEIGELKSTLAEEDMDVEVKAEGNTMVIAFDLSNVPDLDEDTAAAAAELLATSMDSVFEEMAQELASGIAADDTAVEARFLMNGEVIYSQEYSA